MSCPVDLHAHTHFSDGTFSPARLVARAQERGLCAIAVTDHDTTAGIPEAIVAGQECGIEIIPGVEISAKYAQGTLHILGYFIDIENQTLQDRLGDYVEARNRRNPLILNRLMEMGYPLTMDEVAALAGGYIINRPHIAQAMLNRGYVQSKSEAFDQFLGRDAPAYVSREVFEPREAIEIIHAAGGVAVIAHPDQLGSGDVNHIISELRRFALIGVDGIEAYHGGCDPVNCEPYATIAQELGLFITGGSDFHGDVKHCDLGMVRGIEFIPYETVEEMRSACQKYR